MVLQTTHGLIGMRMGRFRKVSSVIKAVARNKNGYKYKDMGKNFVTKFFSVDCRIFFVLPASIGF